MTEPSTSARKRGRPTEAEREERRDDILSAAVDLFVAEGFEPVTLDHIATAARVTKRTIYAYFGDRTEVFLAAVERLRERALREIPAGGDLAQLAQRIVYTLHSDDAVGLHRLAIGESIRFPELAARFYDDGPRTYISALSEVLPEDDKPRAEAVFSLLLGEPHRQRLLGLRPAPDEAEAAAHAEMVLTQLGL